MKVWSRMSDDQARVSVLLGGTEHVLDLDRAKELLYKLQATLDGIEMRQEDGRDK